MDKLNQTDFFFCHSTEDKNEFVLPVLRALEGLGRSVWLDKNKMVVGDDVLEKVQNGLAGSKFVVAFVSNDFLEKPFVDKEIKTAIQQWIYEDKGILPILIGVSHETFSKEFPFLRGTLSLEWEDNPEKMAAELDKAFHQKFTNVGNSKSNPINSDYQNVNFEKLDHLVKLIYVFLRFDQIDRRDPFLPEFSSQLMITDGGWGKTIFPCMKPLYDGTVSKPMRWQGGLAASALTGESFANFEESYFGCRDWDSLPYLKKLESALFNAQNAEDGGFGAWIHAARGGTKPDSSVRHTASALCFLLRMEPEKERIERGLGYLRHIIRDLVEDEPIQDRCPALMMSWLRKAIRDLEGNRYLSKDHADRIESLIFKALSRREAKDVEFYPFWAPYGRTNNAVIHSSLYILSLSPELITYGPAQKRITKILRALFEEMGRDGLPAMKGSSKPDLGMTALFALVLKRLDASRDVGETEHLNELFDQYESIVQKMIVLGNTPEAYRFSWSETLFSILHIGLDAKLSSSLSERDNIEKQIDGMLAADTWREGRIDCPDELRKQFPVLQEVLENMNQALKELELTS
jgi:hypothetical protein